jgi:hypothetical protein
MQEKKVDCSSHDMELLIDLDSVMKVGGRRERKERNELIETSSARELMTNQLVTTTMHRGINEFKSNLN